MKEIRVVGENSNNGEKGNSPIKIKEKKED